MNNSDRQGSTRRSFLARLSIWIGGLAVGGGVFAALRSLIPNVLYEPSKKVKIGTLDLIPDGVTLFKDAKAFVSKHGSEGKTRIHAISAVCTHLGCIVQHTESEESKSGTTDKPTVGFSCACHGSQFTIDGDVVKGPAPEPLPWFAVSVSPDDGQLVVDTSSVVERHKALLVLKSGHCNVRKV
ncbi:MAG: ubiquinol-cytochrome c reductase iron-sulfur subunit [Desulfomonilaceae bacterium]|nr:ubiquinol-cytochrome c reductase iron-sulfur subunit [Desulfomonilaceae bacterium]